MFPLTQQAPSLSLTQNWKQGRGWNFTQERTRGSQDMCPIRGILGQWPSRFLRISQRTGPVVSCNPHWQLHSSTSRFAWICKNIKFFLVQVLSMKKLALHALRPIPAPLEIKGLFQELEVNYDPFSTLEMALIIQNQGLPGNQEDFSFLLFRMPL